jgi:hypothetical protein
MNLRDVALYLAELLAGGAPGAERTLVVCDKDDEAATAAWTKAVFGASGTVVALTTVEDFVAKVTRARTQGTPATRIVIHPRHVATDPEDGSLKLGTSQEGLVALAVPGFKRMEFDGRLNSLLPLLEIGDRWGLGEIVGWTQRFFTGMQPFELKPPRPNTLDQRKAAAADLLMKLGRIGAGNGNLGQFSALPKEADALAEALKGAGPKINVPFEWFEGDYNARLDIANHEIGVKTPRAEVVPQDITFSIERAKIGDLFTRVSSPVVPVPKDVQAITEKRSVEGVIQRMVVAIT